MDQYAHNADVVFRALERIGTLIVVPACAWNPSWSCIAAEELIGLQLWLLGEAITMRSMLVQDGTFE